MEKLRREKRFIGEVLVERQMITPQQLEAALRIQRSLTHKEFLGQVLIRLGYVSEIDIVTALILQCNLPYIAVSKHNVLPEVLDLIPKVVARKERMVPLDRIGNILSVVMQNPMDDLVRAEIEKLSGCQVAVFISTSGEIESALERFYP